MDEETVYYPLQTRNGGRTRFAKTILASVSSGLLMSSVSATFAFPAVALPQLTSSNLTFHLSPAQASWFATLPLFMCIPGSVLGGLLCERLGPRRLMLLLSPLLSISLASMHLASWRLVQDSGAGQAILLATRALQGMVVSLLNPTISAYSCEVCSVNHRGTVASLIECWASNGLVICYIMAGFLRWYTAAWLLPLCTSFPAFLGLYVATESPPWLLRKGREGEATATLRRLGRTPEEVAEELRESRKASGSSVSFRTVARRSNAVPMVFSASLLVLKEVSGLSVLTIYIVRIFQLAGVGLDPFSNSIVVGTSRLIFNFAGSALLHRVPRVTLLALGCLCTLAGTGAIGLFFYLQGAGHEVVLKLRWLPLAALVVYMLGISVGVGPTTWLVAAELLPGEVRSLGLGITVTGYAVTSFMVSKTFEDVEALLGLHGLFWCYSGGCAAYLLFTVFLLPETKGKTLNEIEEFWRKKAEIGH